MENRPKIILREEKIQSIAIGKPDEEKWTFENANEDKGKINALVGYTGIWIESDDDGYITGYEEEVTGSINGNPVTETINVLSSKRIGAIFEVGSGVSYPEYSPTLAEGATMFSKGEDETTIMQAATSDPMQFAPNTLYLLLPR